jgi:hypothetical protein
MCPDSNLHIPVAQRNVVGALVAKAIANIAEVGPISSQELLAQRRIVCYL